MQIGQSITHVDDFCWRGTDNFKNKVIDPLKTVFAIGTEFEKTFKYLGLNITQTKNFNINLDQIQFIDEINQIEISRERTKNKSDKLTDDELKSYRTLIGQLSWAANQTRPDISFSVCELSSAVKHATVEHLLKANKVLKNVKDQQVVLTFPRMKNMQDCTFVTYSDSSFNNLDNGGSQEGFKMFLTDNIGNSSSVIWQSKKIRRVVKSTMAAETLALVDAAEASFWLSKLFVEICSGNKIQINMPLHFYIDSKQLHEGLFSIRPVLDKRLRTERGILREMIEKKEIHSATRISSDKQLANCLTKRGAETYSLLKSLHSK